MPPLQVETGPSKEELEKQQQEREAIEKETKTAEIAEKIERMKNKRLLTAKLAGKSIAEGIYETCNIHSAYELRNRGSRGRG